MHAIYLGHINSFQNCLPTLPNFLSSFFFYNSLSSICATHILTSMGPSTREAIVNLPEATQLRKTDSPSSRIHQLSQFLSQGVGLMSSSLLHADMDWFDLGQILCRQPQQLSLPECTGPVMSRRHCFTPFFPDLGSSRMVNKGIRSKCPIYGSELPQTLIFCTVTIVSFCVNHFPLHIETSLIGSKSCHDIQTQK